MSFGFSASINELDSIKDLQRLISEEIDTVSDFERELTRELKEIEDLKSNIQLITNQMNSIRKLAELRMGLINNVMIEKNKRVTEINFEQCEKWLDMINQIDSELHPLSDIVHKELQRLYVNETHVLFKKSKENQRIMLAIDEKARALVSEIQTISVISQSLDDMIKKFVKELKLIQAERLRRPEKKEFKGFKEK